MRHGGSNKMGRGMNGTGGEDVYLEIIPAS